VSKSPFLSKTESIPYLLLLHVLHERPGLQKGQKPAVYQESYNFMAVPKDCYGFTEREK
jgi:hypothetical protein